MDQETLNRRIDDIHEEIIHVRDDISAIAEILHKNTVILDRNTEDLAYHIKRTDILEEKVNAIELPIRVVKWSFLVAGALGTLFSALYYFLRIIKGV